MLVTVAFAISYFDRQTVPAAISAIQRSIPISNQQFPSLQASFLLAYAALYVIGGRLLDRLGRRAFTSLAPMGQRTALESRWETSNQWTLGFGLG